MSDLSFNMPTNAGNCATSFAGTIDPLGSGSTGVVPFALPLLASGALGDVSDDLLERFVYGGHEAISGAVAWLKDASALGLVRPDEIDKALCKRCRNQALHSLSKDALNRWFLTLSASVRAASGSVGCGLELEPQLSENFSRVALTVMGVELISVSSLYHAPMPVARLAYEALGLLSRTLFPAMLPHELRQPWWLEAMKNDYQILVKAGVAGDPERSYAYMEEHEDLFEQLPYHNPDYESDWVFELLSRKNKNPSWMTNSSAKDPLRRARLLLARHARWRPCRRMYRHPWSLYAVDVLNAILCLYPSRRTLARRHEALGLLTDTNDGGAFIGSALTVYSGDDVESYVVDSEYHSMSEAGEYPALSVSLAALADSSVRATLTGLMTGIGLLARANGLDAEMNRVKKS